jgi:hypothetical protein
MIGLFIFLGLAVTATVAVSLALGRVGRNFRMALLVHWMNIRRPLIKGQRWR